MDAVISPVREFYANLKVRHEGLEVLVRGKLVFVDSHTINSIYKMGFEYDEYAQYLDEHLNYVQIICSLCRAGAEWRMTHIEPVTFAKSNLLAD